MNDGTKKKDQISFSKQFARHFDSFNLVFCCNLHWQLPVGKNGRSLL